MNKIVMLMAGMSLVAGLSGCLSPSGDNMAEKRMTMQKMSDDSLPIFYARYPALKEKISNAAGYAIFNDFGLQIFLPSTESGWGMVYNKTTGEKTYMKMFSLGCGFGLGARDFRALFVFKNQDNIAQFINSGWGLGVQANAVFRFGEVGDGASAAAEVSPGVTLYKITRNGIALQATVQGTKIWGNDDMNAK
ncbi:MAG: YSC84-related protein [Lentisphaerota bacterium]